MTDKKDVLRTMKQIALIVANVGNEADAQIICDAISMLNESVPVKPLAKWLASYAAAPLWKATAWPNDRYKTNEECWFTYLTGKKWEKEA